MEQTDFARVIAQGAELQHRFPGKELVAVGGTAAAIHCGHRFSLDVDCVTPFLQREYNDFTLELERWPGWRTNRKNPPVLILGEREGIELGLRQLRRPVPLRTLIIQGLLVPTISEALRIKAYLMTERRATRDYIDFAALTHNLGEEKTCAALSYLNLLYPSGGTQSVATRFAEVCEAAPVDLTAVNLSDYKGLKAPFTDWKFVSALCQRAGRQLLKRELSGILPGILPDNFE